MLALIRYYDHVEVSNALTDSPVLREIVGWILKETPEALIVFSEKPVGITWDKLSKLGKTGLKRLRIRYYIILKSTIVEMYEITGMKRVKVEEVVV